MSTDLFTLRPTDLVDLAASLMDWRHIRHVPVEDEKGHLVGLVTHRGLLRLLSRGSIAPDGTSMTVREIMKPNPTTVTSSTPTLEAIEIMRRSGIGCLPVVDDNRLVGIVTSYDFLTATASLFKQHLAASARPSNKEKVVRGRADPGQLEAVRARPAPLSGGHRRTNRCDHPHRARWSHLARRSHPMNDIHPVLAEVTDRITARSKDSRTAYLTQVRAAGDRGPARGRLACANLAHGFAASGKADTKALRGMVKPNIAIVSSYNDMLSAHKPFEAFPAQLKQAVLESGGIAQFAGGVPAMCDGITQGRDGMQLSLFSRDVIAMSTAIALSHDMFDATLMLGVCDKIVPGMLIGALAFGHLPTIFVPAGPMTSGLPNGEKAKVRQLYAENKVGREELLDAEAASYHGSGTCTFFGTANSNQLLMEVMGLHLPGSSFVNPGTPLRTALTAEAGRRVTALTALGDDYTPVGEMIDERAIVNGTVALLATGGSTNHTMHLVAIAQAAGISLTWNDISDLSAVVPLLARIYPNGSADVNHFHAAGGLGFAISTLLDAGLLHEDVQTVVGRGLRRYTQEPKLDGDSVMWLDGTTMSHDTSVLRSVDEPFAPTAASKPLRGTSVRR